MYRIRCAEIWGGIQDDEQDICSAGVVASLYSGSCEGGKGGDIYYLSVCGDDLLTRVAIADVVGHGSDVSDVSQWLYSVLEARMGDTDGNAVLGQLNGLVASRGVRALTTAAVMAFHVRDSSLYYSYAGHPPLWLRRSGEASWRQAPLDPETTRFPNAPLGVLPDTEFEVQTLQPETSAAFSTTGTGWVGVYRMS